MLLIIVMKLVKNVNKTLKAVFEILKNPWLLNKVLDDDKVWDKYVKKKYSLNKGLPIIDISELSPNFSEKIEIYSFLDGGSLATDVALLQILSKKFGKCKYFEIGTWRGESVANVARFAEECYTLNLSTEELLQKGLSQKNTELQGFFSKGKENIIHLYGNSMNYNFESIGKKFDLIFIDGDHHYESVKNDTEKIFKYLTHEKSIIVWHDYALTPEKIRADVLAGILDGTPEQYRKNIYHVSNTLCAIFTREKFNTSELNLPTTPNKTFSINLGIQKLL
jgi:predicted O-methyltransferase YrrM